MFLPNAPTALPGKTPRRRTNWPARRACSRKAVGLLASVAALLLVGFGLAQCSPKPYAKIFRPLVNSLNPVKLVPYADKIKEATVHEPLTIPVAGAPAAQLLLYTPTQPAATPRPLVLFIHGGGWMGGTAQQLSPFAKLLAAEGCVVASLDYSLAPEYTYPTPIRQAVAAIDYLQAHANDYGADPAKLFLGGNSAGAQLASQLGAMMTNPAFAKQVGILSPLPARHLKGVILYSGPYNFDTVGKDNFPGFERFIWAYTGQKAYLKYARIDELSTVKQATAAYPPTYLTTGDADPLAPQTAELDSVLRAKGVDVTSRFWTDSGKKLPHDYIFDLTTEAGQTAFQDVVTFIRAKAH